MTVEKVTNETSDTEIISLVLSDKQYYSHVVERYEKKLTRYIKRLAVLSQDDLSDLLQDIFIKAFVNIHKFNTSLSFSSWIYRITHNETINLVRKKKVRSNTIATEDTEELITNISTEEDIEKEHSIKMDTEILQKGLQEIKQKYREILILRFLEEKDYKEISDILKIPSGTVATRISRAKAALLKKCADLNLTNLND